MSAHPGRWPHAADLAVDEPVPYRLTDLALAALDAQPNTFLPAGPVTAVRPAAPIERGNRP
jgi:hypothetical protein